MRRSTPARLAAALAAALTLLTACGLENIPYLEPPVGEGTDIYAFKFRRTLSNSENGPNFQFEGFELYYKFYRTGQPLEDAITTRSGLVSAGFRRICDGTLTEMNKPLIEVAWNDPNVIHFTLDFAGAPEPKIFDDVYPTEVVARREPTYGTTHPLYPEFKSFIYDLSPGNPSYLDTDPDATQIADDLVSPGSIVQLSLYALSYGRQDYVTDLYSDAIYLGTITKNFGW